MKFKNFYVLLFVLIISNNSKSQWIKTNHPESRTIRALACSNGKIISGTFDGDIFITTDNGNNWSLINAGHTYEYFYSILVSG